MFFESVLFATLGAIGEGSGGKVVPKGSKKVSKRDHFEVRVDFWKHLFYYSKTMIFEVLEVLGDDMRTFPGTKATKRALEGCSRVPFCRFGQIFEDFEGPCGRPFWIKILIFFSIRFLIKFWGKNERGRRQGRTLLSLKKPEDLTGIAQGTSPMTRPSHPAGWGRILRLRPCRRPLWQPAAR